MFIRKHCSVTPYMNYKTGFYANLADVTGNFVCWGKILTHDHLSVEIVSFKRLKVTRNAWAWHGHSAKNRKSSCHMIRSLNLWYCFGMIKEDLWLKNLVWVQLSTESFSYCSLSNRGSIYCYVWCKNDGKWKRITAVYCARAKLTQSFLVWVVSLLFTFWKLLQICIAPSLLKSTFQKDY